MNELNIIVAIDLDRAIGRGGDQPYHIRDDFRHFKSLTLGHPVIMGRKTFEALPKGALPGRRNIVITRNPAFAAPGVETAPSLASAIRLASEDPASAPFVIGGGQIYAEALPLATDLYLTIIEAHTPGADTFFPETPADFRLVEESPLLTDEKSALQFRFLHYRRP